MTEFTKEELQDIQHYIEAYCNYEEKRFPKSIFNKIEAILNKFTLRELITLEYALRGFNKQGLEIPDDGADDDLLLRKLNNLIYVQNKNLQELSE